MPGVDLHQHLWPPSFIEALSERSEPPCLVGDRLVTAEGAFPFSAAAHDPEARLRLLDRDGIDSAVLSLQPSLGLETLPAAERDELESAWMDGIAEIVRASGGRFHAFAPWRVADGFVGTTVGAPALFDPERAASLDEAERAGALVFVHPEGPGAPPEGKPEWWNWTAGYTAQMQAAYLAWLAGGRVRWPTLRVLFAILAGGAPFQLERLSQRGVDVRSALDRGVFFDTATYGRRAIELCVETFGVGHLAYGSDTPVVDSRFTLQAVRGFGDAVARMIQIETPKLLLP